MSLTGKLERKMNVSVLANNLKQTNFNIFSSFFLSGTLIFTLLFFRYLFDYQFARHGLQHPFFDYSVITITYILNNLSTVIVYNYLTKNMFFHLLGDNFLILFLRQFCKFCHITVDF